MKKIVALLVGLALTVGALSVFAGCGSSNELTVLMNRTDFQNNVFEDAKEQFEAEFAEQGWPVEFENVSDYEGTTTTRMGGGAYGDVLLIPNSLTVDELSAYFKPLGTVEELEKTYRYVAGKSYEGTVYGLPTYGSVAGILYNKAIFEQAKVDAATLVTPEAFLSAMSTIKSWYASQGMNGVAYYTNFAAEWPLNQWTDAISAAAGNANYLSDVMPWTENAFAEGNPAYDVFKLLYDIVDLGYSETSPTATKWEQSKLQFVNGEIATMVLGSWAIEQFKEVAGGTLPSGVTGAIEGNVEDIGYMPFPFTAEDGERYAVSASDYMIGIAANTKNEEGARAFVDWFLNDFRYYEKCGGIPPQVTGEYPEEIKSFETSGVTLLEADVAVYETAQSVCEIESGTTMWSADWKKPFVEEAIKNGGKSFADLIAELNENWNEGVAAVKEEISATAPSKQS